MKTKRSNEAYKEPPGDVDSDVGRLMFLRFQKESETTFRDEHEFWYLTEGFTFAPSYRLSIEQYWREVEPIIGHLKVREIDLRVVRAFEALCLKSGNSVSTVNKKVGFIRSILNHSIRNDRISTHLLKHYKFQRAQDPKIEFLNREQAIRLLRTTKLKYPSGSPLHWHYLSYLIAINTGLRASELWALKKKCFVEDMLVIEEQYGLKNKKLTALKGKSMRHVPISKAVVKELEPLLRSLNDNDLIFTRDGKPICHYGIRKRFDKDIRDAGLGKVKFHALRHTAATLMISAGINLKIVQTILGHKDIQTTMKYVHALGEDIKSVAQRFSVTPD